MLSGRVGSVFSRYCSRLKLFAFSGIDSSGRLHVPAVVEFMFTYFKTSVKKKSGCYFRKTCICLSQHSHHMSKWKCRLIVDTAWQPCGRYNDRRMQQQLHTCSYRACGETEFTVINVLLFLHLQA